jgi:hypothetical protein
MMTPTGVRRPRRRPGCSSPTMRSPHHSGSCRATSRHSGWDAEARPSPAGTRQARPPGPEVPSGPSPPIRLGTRVPVSNVAVSLSVGSSSQTVVPRPSRSMPQDVDSRATRSSPKPPASRSCRGVRRAMVPAVPLSRTSRRSVASHSDAFRRSGSSPHMCACRTELVMSSLTSKVAMSVSHASWGSCASHAEMAARAWPGAWSVGWNESSKVAAMVLRWCPRSARSNPMGRVRLRHLRAKAQLLDRSDPS